MRAPVVFAVVASFLVPIAACEEDYKDCYGEDLIACTCASGANGYAKCGPSGDYKASACVCDGNTPGVDAGGCRREAGAGDGGCRDQ